MRVAMVAAAWEVDDDERNAHIADLSTALSGHGHDVTLYLRHGPVTPLRQKSGSGGYRVVQVPVGPATRLRKADLVAHLDAFGAFLDEEWAVRPPDVAHLHSWMSGLAVATGQDVPLVQSFHGLGAVEDRFRSTAGSTRADLERLVGTAAQQVLAASGEEVFDLVRMGVDRSRVSLVPFAVDADRFRPDGRPERSGRRSRLLAVGDLAPHSGFHTAISALAQVPDAELVIVGRSRHANRREDPEVRRLVQHARGLGVARRVSLVEPVDPARMPAVLRSADVLVCPQWYEPLGATALQAMACGVPVVASAVGALSDLVVDDVTGLLVPPRDPRTLGNELRELLADRTRRQMYAIAGADRARVRYSWDRVAAETVVAYGKARAHTSTSITSVEGS
jgi:glycosyltransferase involved in cell wall biosynthesis